MINTSKTTFTKWKSKVNTVMLSTYGIDTTDAGEGDERLRDHWRTGESAEHFVQWYGEKYDLISKRDMGIEGW